MKSLLIAILMILSLSSVAQDKKADPENKVVNLNSLPKEKATVESLTKTAIKTTNVIIYNDNKYPVYKSNRGKFFIIMLSRNGNYYKKYVDESILK